MIQIFELSVSQKWSFSLHHHLLTVFNIFQSMTFNNISCNAAILCSTGNKKFTHTYTNLQLKAAGLFKYVWPFFKTFYPCLSGLYMFQLNLFEIKRMASASFFFCWIWLRLVINQGENTTITATTILNKKTLTYSHLILNNVFPTMLNLHSRSLSTRILECQCMLMTATV